MKHDARADKTPSTPPATRSSTRARRYAIALDVGGTFTDVALLDQATGRLWIAKTPTTPEDPAEGFLAGVDKALSLAGASPLDLNQILHVRASWSNWTPRPSCCRGSGLAWTASAT